MQVCEEYPTDIPPSHLELGQALQSAAPGVEEEFLIPASTRVLGPKRFMTGGGQPVPRRVTLIAGP